MSMQSDPRAQTSSVNIKVNGQPLRERHVLVDGDEIRIGPAAIRYVQNSAFPIDLAEIDLSPRTPEESPCRFFRIGARYCAHSSAES